MAKNSFKVPKRIGSFKVKKRHRKALGNALIVLEAAQALGLLGAAGGLLSKQSKKGKKHPPAGELHARA